MATYIELEVAVRAFNNFDAGRADSPPCTLLTPEEFAEYLDELPAADVAPVVHGRWEYPPQTFNTLGQIRCPFCAWWSLDPSIDGIYNYCPNCGAKMDGGADNG